MPSPKEALSKLIAHQICKRETLWPDEDGQHYTANLKNLEKIGDSEAARFVSAFDEGLVCAREDGDFIFPATNRTIRVFNHIGSSTGKQVLSVAVEPIITVSLMYWLHTEMEWPAHLLITETLRNGFDLSCRDSSCSSWRIHAEAKTSRSEVERLAIFLADEINGESPSRPRSPKQERNWIKKAVAYSSEPAPVLLVYGPNEHRVIYKNDGGRFVPGSEGDLAFSKCL